MDSHEKVKKSLLQKRIEAAQREIEQYPDWVKRNMVFQGGRDERDVEEDFKSYGNY